MTDSCLACDLYTGARELPGGRIAATEHWVVEHTVGPLGVGTLIVKPIRHCTHVWDLTPAEAAELGPLLRRVADAIRAILQPDQVYVCLWSHAGWQPVHIHFVLQPAWNHQREQHALGGPFLQADLFAANAPLPRADVEAFAARARQALAGDRA